MTHVVQCVFKTASYTIVVCGMQSIFYPVTQCQWTTAEWGILGWSEVNRFADRLTITLKSFTFSSARRVLYICCGVFLHGCRHSQSLSEDVLRHADLMYSRKLHIDLFSCLTCWCKKGEWMPNCPMWWLEREIWMSASWVNWLKVAWSHLLISTKNKVDGNVH